MAQRRTLCRRNRLGAGMDLQGGIRVRLFVPWLNCCTWHTSAAATPPMPCVSRAGGQLLSSTCTQVL
jgi:hypothetical protein